MRSTSLLRATWLALTLALSVGSVACNFDDTGEPCRAAQGGSLPEVDRDTNGEPGSQVRFDLRSSCYEAWCVAHAGVGQPYCTRACSSNGDCPSGFSCARVLESDPGPDTQSAGTFCVRAE